MNKFIKFKSGIKLSSPVGLRYTQKFYEQLMNSSWDIEQVTKDLSTSPTLLLTSRKDKNKYTLHTCFGEIICSSSNNDGSVSDNLNLIYFSPVSLDGQNRALTYGVCFEPEYIIIKIYLRDAYNISCEIAKGETYRANSFRTSADVIMAIDSEMEKAKARAKGNETSEDEDEIYTPVKGLSKILNIAENYSNISYSLEKTMVTRIGDIPYDRIESSDYNRMDRPSYDLIVEKLDESVVKKGTQINITDKLGELHTAEIIGINKEGDAYRLSALFTKQVDISLFSSIGWFSLSLSSVNRDVQREAIEKIRNGESAAKYMDDVLGKHEPQKYVLQEMSDLKSNLKKKKYPPNESQVKAIVSGISCPDVFLVMGPPGTGKTTVILEWVKYFVLKEHKRVLVSSQNNKAVDNVLARIADEEGIDIIRIGSESKVQTETRQFLFENKILEKRNGIIQDTQKNLDKIRRIAENWLIYYNSVHTLYSEQIPLLQKKNEFQSIAQEKICKAYDRLISLNREDREIRKEKEFLHDEISSLYNTVISSRNNKSFIKRIIGKVTNYFHEQTLRKRVAEYDVVCQRELEIVNEYNTSMEKMNLLFKEAYALFWDYYSSFSVWEENAQKVIAGKPATPNIWNLFKNIELTDEMISKGIDLKDSLKSIQSEYERALSISAVIEEWKNKTENQKNYALNKIILESVDLVGATCIGINSQKRFADLNFDVTIIDEAGQIQIHNALVPMSVSNKLIMLGDHKQIPPSVDQEMLDVCNENLISTEYLEKSLFEKMYEFMPVENKIMLDTQYRMPKEIADTISSWFYDGNYHSPDFKSNQKSLIPELSSKPFVFIDTSKVKGKQKHEERIPNQGCRNALEASIIISMIKHIVKHNELDIKEIGVISAYNSQVELIKSSLVQKTIVDDETANDIVATLDSFQGQERDIIFYSFTRSSGASPKARRIGFLNELRRLNVAMTRCKKNLILIGDLKFLSSCENENTDENGKPVIQGSEKEFSDFMNHVKKALEAGCGEIIPYSAFVRKMGQ